MRGIASHDETDLSKKNRIKKKRNVLIILNLLSFPDKKKISVTFIK